MKIAVQPDHRTTCEGSEKTKNDVRHREGMHRV
jgi:hypothetical protein